MLALATAIVAVADLSAHRRDEYLQAARLALDPGGVQLELDLTPGIAVAEAIIADIDHNRDGALSQDEQQAYASLVLGSLQLQVDGTPVPARLAGTSFPDVEAMRRGEGAIRLQTTAAFPTLSAGRHQLLFRNGHDADRSVYLANALAPASQTVAITAQRRDIDQTQLTIEYVLRAAPATSTDKWLLGSLVAAMVVVLGIRRSRSAALPRDRGGSVSEPRQVQD